MTDPGSPRSAHLRRRILIGAVWAGALAALLGALVAMPALSQRHFREWRGSRNRIVDELVAEGRWQAALGRVDRMIQRIPWDPRPLHRRAEILRDQLVGRRYDTAADAEVTQAFAEACRAYFHMAIYPALISPSTRRRMADAYYQWGVCASRRADWPLLAFCMEYAADLDPTKVDEIIRQTVERPDDLTQVPSEILAASARILARHRTRTDVLEFLERCRGGIPEEQRLVMALETIARRDASRGRDEILRVQSGSEVWNEILHFGLLGRSMAARIAYMPIYGVMSAGRTGRRDPMEWLRLGRFEELLAEARIEAPDGPLVETDMGWLIARNQQLIFTWDETPPRTDSICLMLRGDVALDVWPAIETEVNGGSPSLHLVRSAAWIGLNLDVPGGDLRSLSIRFVNDGGFPRLSPGGETIRTLQDRNVTLRGGWRYTGDGQG